LGAWLYWLFGNGFTKPPRLLSISQIQQDEKVVNVANSIGGFEYSDAYLHDNDSRFVFNFIRAALDRGAVAANYRGVPGRPARKRCMDHPGQGYVIEGDANSKYAPKCPDQRGRPLRGRS
jgi:hypothetical protein